MTSKAYIVANEQQESEVLEKLEREGYVWSGGEKPTEWIPSKNFITDDNFPIAIIKDLSKHITFDSYYDDFNSEQYDIIYNGQKEEQMSDKYVVSQEFMNRLNEWRDNLSDFSMSENFVGPTAIDELDDIVDGWWNITDLSGEEQNSRLIAILNWVNGEDVFEVEKLKKWVVRSKETDEDGDYHYVNLDNFKNLKSVSTLYGLDFATKFDTKEEAQSWANSHQEVIEVEE